MTKRTDKITLENQILKREAEIQSSSKLFSHLSASLLGILFVLALGQFELDGIKGILCDALFRTQWWTTPDPEVALIAYDDSSAVRYDGSIRIPAEEIAQVLSALADDQAKTVVLLSAINEKVYTEAELKLIGKSLALIPGSLIGYTDDESLGRKGANALGDIPYLPGYVSRDTFSYGADSVTRRVMITINGLPTVYSRFLPKGPLHRASGSHGYEHTGHSLQTYINWQGRAGTYLPTSSRTVAERRFRPHSFTGKTVILGSALPTRRIHDFILSPYSRSTFAMPALEGAAQSLVTLKRDNGIYRTSSAFKFFFALLTGLLTVNMALYLSPGKGILFLVAEVSVLIITGWVALFKFDVWFDLAHPLVVAGVGYYLVIPYRLVDEYRKRWHYQEKSELMIQLEQLKSNFLSLISHDLKTPIARIQGNAELLLDEPDHLTERQRRSLNAMVQTTEDLSHYVETVLDLTRIESAQVPLQKSSKDINTTIMEVIESKRSQAEERGIQLATSLEPIFSFKFDQRLMRRVVDNLVENAIKYSPDGSRIELSSREEGNWVKIDIADHGVGIASVDQEKIFQKFYRCENEKTRDIKGTGLGLYLVKYFVELHQGMIELKSELGKGSVFTVSLPV